MKFKHAVLNLMQSNSARRWVTVAVTLVLALGLAAPALAQGGGGVGDVVNTMVKSITDIIQSICVGAGILGLSMWAIGKVVRPVFPQVSGLTQNYIPDLLIGIAVVFVASQIVEGLASSLGASGG
jgi:type IV secretory pathway VirB2 component (pilin)